MTTAAKKFRGGESISAVERFSRMTSLAILGAWYLPSRRELDLLFPSGRRYRYLAVPEDVARRFAQAEVKGRFFNAEIRDRFACREIHEQLPAAA